MFKNDAPSSQVSQVGTRASRARRFVWMSRLTILSILLFLLASYFAVNAISAILSATVVWYFASGGYDQAVINADRTYWWCTLWKAPFAWVGRKEKYADPKWQAIALKGMALFRKGSIKEAYPYLSYAAVHGSPYMSNYPLLGDLFLEAGVAGIHLGYYEEAVIYLRRAVQQSSRTAEAYFYLGEALIRVDAVKGAKEAWRKAIEEGKEPWKSKASNRLRLLGKPRRVVNGVLHSEQLKPQSSRD
ncbi:MAG: hypothetical protein KatS3mg023_1948 [Armatimonadota bacterium]|nr:MAG: hypothetical protein KatS3mg023_1948 [Armatimonadota bacterium]